MSKKDPAFLLYSKDWLEGTSEMTLAEKGAYIDLLANQHQKGSLPSETKRLCKLARCGESEFSEIWTEVAKKFVPYGEGRLVNRKLTDVVTERLEKSKRNKIISALGIAVRQSKLPAEIKQEAKRGFNINDFINIPEPIITEKVTEWFTERLNIVGNPNGLPRAFANANEDANANIYNNSIVSTMLQFFKKFNPEYPESKEKDFNSCWQIALKIGKSKGWTQEQILNGHQEDVLKSWDKIIEFTVSDKWFSGRSIFDINNEWQRLIQSMNKKVKEVFKINPESDKIPLNLKKLNK